MNSGDQTEHFVTLFDSKFIVSGLALYESLARNCRPFKLWVVAVDATLVDFLGRLTLPGLMVLPLAEIETDALRATRPKRTIGEYCWTLTPFVPQAVLDRDPSISRVTYIDSDLYFFDSPSTFFAEFDSSGKDVMITEHAWAPGYAYRTRLSGRFCVQFMTFRNTPGARKVMRWWQERCLEWCYARYEDGKFGDQKYLDHWPELFPAEVHILTQLERTLAPWNVNYYSKRAPLRPVFYHFQAFRILSPTLIKLYQGFRVGAAGRRLYETYIGCVSMIAGKLASVAIPLPIMPEHRQRFRLLKYAFLMLQGKIRFSRRNLGEATPD